MSRRSMHGSIGPADVPALRTPRLIHAELATVREAQSARAAALADPRKLAVAARAMKLPPELARGVLLHGFAINALFIQDLTADLSALERQALLLTAAA